MKRKIVILLIVILFSISMFDSLAILAYAHENRLNIKDEYELTSEDQSINDSEQNKIDFRAGDITAPVLDVSSLKVDKKEVTVGDRIKVSFKASDDISGIKYAFIYYKKPQTGKQEGIIANYNSITGLYEGEMYIDDTMESGKWEMYYIYLEDNRGNEVCYYNSSHDLSAAEFKVSGTSSDITAPVLDVSSLKVDKKEVTVGDRIKVSFKASDDISGIKYAFIYYKKPQTGKQEGIIANYNSITGLYEGEMYIDDTMESGKWEMYYIYLEDNRGNEVCYYNSSHELSSGNFNIIDEENDYEAIEGVTVVTKNETWSNKTITGDVYIGPDAVLQISGNVNIYGNLYVLGALKSYGGLNLSGTLYGRSTSFGGSPTLYNGTIVISGSNSIASMIMTTYPVTDIPVRIDEIEYSSANKISIKGATLKIADMYIDGELVNLDYKGRFSLDNIDTNGKDKITITFVTVFGNTITREVDIPKSNDVNGDGVIDILDLSLIAKSYNKSKSDSDWNSKFDLNDDGIIDIFDLVSISKKI